MAYKLGNSLQLTGTNNFTLTPSSGELNFTTDTLPNAVKIKNDGEIITRGKFSINNGTYTLSISIPAGISGDLNITLPTTLGSSGQVLSSTGSATTWITPYSDPTTTAGDMVIRNGSNILSRLPVGSDNQRLVARDGIPTWRQQFEPMRETMLYDEFCGTTSPFGDIVWLLFVGSCTVAAALPTGATTGFGCSRFLFSASGSYGGIGRNVTSGFFMQANATLVCETMIWLDSLGSVADQYIFRVGFGDQFIGSTDMNNGIYLEYNIATSGNWLIKTAAGGVRTTVTSTTAVVSGAWIRCGFTATSSLVTFFINGTNIGTINSNIPTTSSNRMSPAFRSGRSAGTTASTYAFFIDYFYYHMSFSSDRY